MSYIAAIEVDQRQRIVNSSDALKEMLGGSWNIETTQSLADQIIARRRGILGVKVSSGDIWLRSDDLEALSACLQEFRSEIVGELNLPCSFAVIEECGSLEDSRKALSREIRRIKDSKNGEIGHLSLPWFASCQIQPDQYANCWHPDESTKAIHKRRELESDDSDARSTMGWNTVNRFYESFTDLERYALKKPFLMDDFSGLGADQYLALLRFDVDNASALFDNLQPVTTPVGDDARGPWKSFAECSKAFSECIEVSFNEAFHGTVKDALARNALVPRKSFFPISPLINAGDDLLIVIREDLALDFACRLMEIHAGKAKVNQVLESHKSEEAKAITLSGSIVFARSGFPFSVLSKISEAVERSAKKHRGMNGSQEPCLDIYWLESTGREDPIQQRLASLAYEVSNATYSLCTLPWTLTQATAMSVCARKIEEAGIARGKWHQLLAALKAGEPHGSLAYHRWLQHLESSEQKCMRDVAGILQACQLWSEDAAPWFVLDNNGVGLATPLLELHELREMLGAGEPLAGNEVAQ